MRGPGGGAAQRGNRRADRGRSSGSVGRGGERSTAQAPRVSFSEDRPEVIHIQHRWVDSLYPRYRGLRRYVPASRRKVALSAADHGLPFSGVTKLAEFWSRGVVEDISQGPAGRPEEGVCSDKTESPPTPAEPNRAGTTRRGQDPTGGGPRGGVQAVGHGSGHRPQGHKVAMISPGGTPGATFSRPHGVRHLLAALDRHHTPRACQANRPDHVLALPVPRGRIPPRCGSGSC